MHYQISRNGQMYGPYTLEDLQRYLASGNILPTDMAKTEAMTEWHSVSEILGQSGGQAFGAPAASNPVPGASADVPVAGPGGAPAQPYGNVNLGTPPYGGPGYADPTGAAGGSSIAALASSPYPDAPNLNWGLVLLFCFLTCGLFMPIWNLVIAAWLRRVQPNATSLFYYIAVVALYFVHIIVGGVSSVSMMSHPGSNMLLGTHLASRGIILLAIWIVRLIARYSQRASLEEHFNGPEPVGLRLDPVMTFFFGGIYFQYHLNRINALKQAARFGMGRAF